MRLPLRWSASLGERLRFGADLPAARERIERDVRRQFDTLSSQLETAVTRLRSDQAVVVAASTRELAGTRELFDRLADVAAALDLPGVAVTVYGPEARPMAWAGRPATLPIVRITGPEALFLAPSSLGLRLTRVAPVVDPAAPERRMATIVAEAPLPRAGRYRASRRRASSSTRRSCPCRCGAAFEGAADAST